MAFRTLAEAVTHGRGRERAFCCPVHGDSRASASVNIVKGVWVCYTCGARGTLNDIVESPDYEFAAGLLGVLDEAAPQPYSESWLGLTHQPGRHHPYWLSRFTPRAIDHFRLGYDSLRVFRGQPVPAPCYPMRDPGGAVLGLVHRQLHAEPKYVYPRGVTKSDLLFNYSFEQVRFVWLVEGALDAVAAWEAGQCAFGLYGSQISNAQIRLLHRAGVAMVGLALDNDPAGRTAVTGWHDDTGRYIPGIAHRLAAAGFAVAHADWSGTTAKDLPDLAIEERHAVLTVSMLPEKADRFLS